MVDINKVEEVVNFWGNKIPMLTMEEAGELIQAISKIEREDGEDKEKYSRREQELIGEIGDMYISLLALRIYYGLDLNKIKIYIGKKLDKKY